MQVNRISASHLRHLMDTKGSKLLLLDFRPFLVYNNEHIAGAINAFCPSILKRRFAASGCLPIETIVTQDVRRKLRNGEFNTLVLYDNDDNVHENSDLGIIMQGLSRDKNMFKTASILKGGFPTFHSKYPMYCTSRNISRDGCKDHSARVSPVTPCLAGQRALQNVPTQLLPHLFIGNKQNSLDYDLLRNIGVTAILNVSTACSDYILPKDFNYKSIPVKDNETENISAWFSEALQFIESVRHANGKVLVHCRAGISRSATICIAYIMVYKSMSLEQAFEFVRARRDIISPNLNFMQQLFEFERLLLVESMRQIVYPSNAVTELSPLTCSKASELSPAVLTNRFTFNICAISQT